MIASNAVRAQAIKLGFDLVGITQAEPSPTLDAYLRWVAAGMHGTMGYMAREDRQARRRDLNVIVPGARSLVVVGVNYSQMAQVDADLLTDPTRGRIASYAWGLDYHDVLLLRLRQLGQWLVDQMPDIHQRAYVDTGAILERSHAQQAGLGFIGKNTMLIHTRLGSDLFLGEIVTDIPFDAYDSPHRETMCGTCTRCLTACPTAAFPRPYVLDARRCISYLTIEHKGVIARDLRPLMANWVFGCDICQTVCPWQRFARPTHEPAFRLDSINRAAPKLADVLRLQERQFQATYHGSPVQRIGRDRLVRNACIAAGNAGDPALIPLLIERLEDESPLVRAHAAWAVGRYRSAGSLAALKAAQSRETDPIVLQELALGLVDEV